MAFSNEEKIAGLRRILESDPSDYLGRFMLGKLLMDEKKFHEAATEFQAVIAAKGDYSAAYRLLGDAYRLSEQPDQARMVYEQGIQIAEEKGDLQTMKEMQVFLRRLDSEG